MNRISVVAAAVALPSSATADLQLLLQSTLGTSDGFRAVLS